MLACPSLSLLGSSSVLACPCRSLIRHACNPHACPSLSSSRPVNACMHACMPSRHLTSVVHPRVQPHQHRLALDGRQELNRRPVSEGGARRLALGRRTMARVPMGQWRGQEVEGRGIESANAVPQSEPSRGGGAHSEGSPPLIAVRSDSRGRIPPPADPRGHGR